MGPETPIRIPNPDAQRKSRARITAQTALDILHNHPRAASRVVATIAGGGTLAVSILLSGGTLLGVAVGSITGTITYNLVRQYEKGPYG